MPDRGAAELIQIILDRPGLCHVLESETFDRDDITSHLDVSRSTTHRLVRKLSTNGVIERTNSEYRLTEFGTILTAEVEQTIQRIEIALDVNPLLEAVTQLDVDVDISLFQKATVITKEGNDSSEIESYLVRLVEDATVVRNASETIISHRYLSTLFDRMNEGATVDVISTEDAIEFISTTHPEPSSLYTDATDGTIYLQNEIPLTVILADDRACLGISNETLPQLDMLVSVDEPEAVEWVESVYESIRTTATPYTPDSIDA